MKIGLDIALGTREMTEKVKELGLDIFVSDSPTLLMDVWEILGIPCVLFNSIQNQWFEDPIFKRIFSLSELEDVIKKDPLFAEHENPQDRAVKLLEVRENAIYFNGEEARDSKGSRENTETRRA